MTAGMAGVIAAVLAKHRNYVRNEDLGGVVCDECGWEVASKWPEANATESTIDRRNQHESHAVAEELARAGYGLLPKTTAEALAEAADRLLELGRWPVTSHPEEPQHG